MIRFCWFSWFLFRNHTSSIQNKNVNFVKVVELFKRRTSMPDGRQTRARPKYRKSIVVGKQHLVFAGARHPARYHTWQTWLELQRTNNSKLFDCMWLFLKFHVNAPSTRKSIIDERVVSVVAWPLLSDALCVLVMYSISVHYIPLQMPSNTATYHWFVDRTVMSNSLSSRPTSSAPSLNVSLVHEEMISGR